MKLSETIKHNNEDIDVYDEMPTGWSYVKGALTAPQYSNVETDKLLPKQAVVSRKCRARRFALSL